MLTFGQTGLGTGCSHSCVNHLGVTESGHLAILIAMSAHAGVQGITILGAGRIDHGLGSVVVCAHVVERATLNLSCNTVVAFHHLVGVVSTVVGVVCRIKVIVGTAVYVDGATAVRQCFVNVQGVVLTFKGRCHKGTAINVDSAVLRIDQVGAILGQVALLVNGATCGIITAIDIHSTAHNADSTVKVAAFATVYGTVTLNIQDCVLTVNIEHFRYVIEGYPICSQALAVQI